MTEYSTAWKSSKNPTKQRKYRMNAPQHAKRKFMAATLSKKLREEHKKRSTIVRVGDKVRVMRGTHKGKSGKIERVDLKHERIYVVGLEHEKIDGSKARYPVHPSNVLIEELNTDDKRRFKHPKPTKKVESKKEEKKPTEKKQEKKAE